MNDLHPPPVIEVQDLQVQFPTRAGLVRAVDGVSFDVAEGAIAGLPELFRGLASARMLVFGLALMAMMVFRPQGLWPRRSEGAA